MSRVYVAYVTQQSHKLFYKMNGTNCFYLLFDRNLYLCEAQPLGMCRAIAIRWNEVPGRVPLKKNKLFAQLSGHKDLCTLSCTREMTQNSGGCKNVRCIAVKFAAFSKNVQQSLVIGKGL